jgi:hypothetical protein
VIGFRGTEQFRRQLHREALDRGIKVQTLLEQAVAAYLAAEPSPAPAPAVPDGCEMLIVPRAMAPILRAMAAWIEKEGSERVLATLAPIADSQASPATDTIPLDARSDRSAKKLRPKHA